MIDDWTVKTAAMLQVTRLTRSSVRTGFAPRPVRVITAPLRMKALEVTAQSSPHRLDLHQRQAIGVHQRHENAAEQVVECREEDQREQSGNGDDEAEGPGQIDPPRRIMLAGVARFVDMDEEQVQARRAPRAG